MPDGFCAISLKKQINSDPMPLELIPPLQICLLTVSCPQTLTSDGEKLEQ